jgi:hypothetical protein
METLEKAEFLISVDSLDEKYNNQNQVCVKLIIDYKNKAYEIIPPSMKIETKCKLPLLISKAIQLAYDKVMAELY